MGDKIYTTEKNKNNIVLLCQVLYVFKDYILNYIRPKTNLLYPIVVI